MAELHDTEQAERRREAAHWLGNVDRVWLVKDRSGKPHEIAHGGVAAILLGRLKPHGRPVRRVAVKETRIPLTDEQAYSTQDCIDALGAAGVRLPRMFLYPLALGWVVVSQLFGGTARGSRFCQPSAYYRRLTVSERRYAVDQLTRVANAGYLPALDLFVVLEPQPWEVVPLDLDLIHPSPDPDHRVRCLMRCAMQIADEKEERHALIDTLRSIAAGPTADALARELANASSPFRPYWA